MNRTTQHGPTGQARHGVTLVELLVVIGIIVLLAGLLLPTISQVRRQARRGASLATINLLTGAIQQYRNDFNDYPPSDARPYRMGRPGDEPQGRNLLVLLLTGYPGDPESLGVPMEGGRSLFEDSGSPDFGFRMQRRGLQYGPYNGAENVRVVEDGQIGGGTLPPAPLLAFVDAFDEPISYYRFTPPDGYRDEDNKNDGLSNTNDYASSDGRFFRQDYVLMSRGPNARWNPFHENTATDDITNFLQE